MHSNFHKHILAYTGRMHCAAHRRHKFNPATWQTVIVGCMRNSVRVVKFKRCLGFYARECALVVRETVGRPQHCYNDIMNDSDGI